MYSYAYTFIHIDMLLHIHPDRRTLTHFTTEVSRETAVCPKSASCSSAAHTVHSSSRFTLASSSVLTDGMEQSNEGPFYQISSLTMTLLQVLNCILTVGWTWQASYSAVAKPHGVSLVCQGLVSELQHLQQAHVSWVLMLGLHTP